MNGLDERNAADDDEEVEGLEVEGSREEQLEEQHVEGSPSQIEGRPVGLNEVVGELGDQHNN